MPRYSTKTCFGLDESHIVFSQSLNTHLAASTIAAFEQLQSQARLAGFEPAIISGYRSFDRQLAIWNAKAEGRRLVVDDAGQPVDILSLSQARQVDAILRWSALPGTSRHHWGSDFDVYDKAALPEGYKVQLTPDECSKTGVFGAFHEWLDEELSRPNCPFYRPYSIDRGGVACEPWHLSYRPLAQEIAPLFSVTALAQELEQQPLALKETVISNLTDIIQRFVYLG